MLRVNEVMKYVPDECDTIKIHHGDFTKSLDCYGSAVQDYVEDYGDSVVDTYAYEGGVFHVTIKMSKMDLKITVFDLMDKILDVLKRYDNNINYFSCCYIDKSNDNDDDFDNWFNMSAKHVGDDNYIDISKRW
jgi:hypothetical protein